MQTKQTQANFISPEFASAGFFMLFGSLFLIFTKYTLLPLNVSHQLPLLSSLIVILFTAAFLGRVFARLLIKPQPSIRLFIIGILMAMAAILIISLSFFIRSWIYGAPLLQLAHNWQDYFIIFGLLVVTTSSVIGLWLAILTGMAAIYFNKRFYPKLMAFNAAQPTSKDTPNE